MEYLGKLYFDEEKKGYKLEGEDKTLKPLIPLCEYMEDNNIEHLLYKNYLIIKEPTNQAFNIYYVENEDEVVSFLGGEYPEVVSEEDYKKIKRKYFKIDKKYIIGGAILGVLVLGAITVLSMPKKKEVAKTIVKKEIILTKNDYKRVLPYINNQILSKINEKIEKYKLDGNTSGIKNIEIKVKYGKKGVIAKGKMTIVYLYPMPNTKKVKLGEINKKKIYGFTKDIKVKIRKKAEEIKKNENKEKYPLCIDKIYALDLEGKLKILLQSKGDLYFEKEIKNEKDVKELGKLLDNCSIYIDSIKGDLNNLKFKMHIKTK